MLTFSEDETPPRAGLVVSFDLSGFSDFCNHPDAHSTLPKLEKAVFRNLQYALNATSLTGGPCAYERVPQPDHSKFTGDGALMIWVKDELGDFDRSFGKNLVMAMRAFQDSYAQKVSHWEQLWRCGQLPKTLRVGIAAGNLHQMIGTEASQPVEFVGYCINLAVRLQDHFKPLGFLVQSKIQPDLPDMIELNALQIRGANDETVCMFREDYDRVYKIWGTKVLDKFGLP